MRALSSFIGRDAYLKLLSELVVERRLVTVVGPGGVGKTRFVTEWIARSRHELPEAHVAELASIAPSHAVGPEIAGQLGFPSVDALLAGFADARALVVLDNCEHIRDAASRFCTRLLAACPGLHVVATSREALGVDGEHVLVLEPLGLPARGSAADDIDAAPSVRLFIDRALATGARLETTTGQMRAIADLCRRLDGLPLAIELAAARSRSMAPTELLLHLDRRFELLQRSSPTASVRHVSLRAAIDTSYELLTPEELEFYPRLAAFAGPFDVDLAHAVAAREDADRLATVDLVSRLVDRSLVVAVQRAGVTSYALLDSLRAYGADVLRARGEWDTAQERFVSAMLGRASQILVEGLARWSAFVFAGVLGQLRNLGAAVDLCLARDSSGERAVHLLLPMWAGVHQGRAGEVAALSDRILARWPEGSEAWRPRLLAIAATAYLVDGRIHRGVSLAQEALSATAADPLAELVARRALGLAAARVDGDATGAAMHFATGRDVARRAGSHAFARELGSFHASVCPPAELEAVLASLMDTAREAAGDDDLVAAVWAELVATQRLIEADRRGDAANQLAVIERRLIDLDYPFGRNAALRFRTVLGTLESGWPAMRTAWAEVVDRVAASGDLGELASTLRTAAALAGRAGDEPAALALLAAVPQGPTISALAPLFADQAVDTAESTALGAARAGSPESSAPSAPRVDTPEALRRLRSALRPPDLAEPVPAPAAASATSEALAPSPRGQTAMLRSGDVWSVSFAGRTVQVRHQKGLEDLVVLLSRPGHEVHSLELVGGTSLGGDPLPGVDERARTAYRGRIRELQAEIDEARAQNDPPAAERAEAELDALVRQLSESFGLGGRARPRAAAAERARSTVAWRLRAAMKRVAQLHPELGRHLENSVRTGTWCVYRPESPVVWQIDTASS